jgi:AbrB family looped-hinge helix DNA binding protein
MSTENEPEGKTTRITRKGQVTIPKELREEFGLEEGDELLWQKTEEGIRVRKTTRSAGRGMLVDGDVSVEKREEMDEEMEPEIREKRQTEWTHECRGTLSMVWLWPGISLTDFRQLRMTFSNGLRMESTCSKRQRSR